MEYGIDKVTRQRVFPTKGLKAICQCCETDLVAKCGKIKIKHWAHKSKCIDHWWEPETEWHRNWKSYFPPEWREVVIFSKTNKEKHVADVFCTNKQLIIEFQNSSISGEEIQAREFFYDKMIWVLNEKRLSIKIQPLDHLFLEMQSQFDSFINERINDAIYISEMKSLELLTERDRLLKNKKKGSFTMEFGTIRSHFENMIDDLISQESFSNNTSTGLLKPSLFKKDLFNPIKEKAIKEINLLIEQNKILPPENQYFSYEKKSNITSVWDYSKKNVFIDNNHELLWLISDKVLKKVPKSHFISKYSTLPFLQN